MSLSEKSCVVQNMKDNGVVPIGKLSATDLDHTDGGKTVILRSPSPSAETPVWQEVKLTPATNLKSATVTPIGSDGKPTGQATTATPSSPSTPTTIKFTAPTSADHVVVELHPATPGKPTDAAVASVVACMPDEGMEELILRLYGI